MINSIFLYIDPGSGSYLVQVLIAGVLGVVFFFKNLRLYIKSFFTRAPKKTNTTDTSADAKT